MSRPEKELTEIIRPVKIPGKNRETGKSFIERHRWTTVGMLVFALLFTVIGGVLFLRYLAKHPLAPAKAVGPERNGERVEAAFQVLRHLPKQIGMNILPVISQQTDDFCNQQDRLL